MVSGATTVEHRAKSVESFVSNLPKTVEHTTGLPFWLVIVLTIIAGLALALVFDSSQGRGRRYRRGYRVAYLEQLGKERAKIRSEQERKGEKKSGIRER